MTTPAQPGPPGSSPYGPYAPGSSFGSAFNNLTSMSDNMAATATAGAGGHFKVDTDALQSVIKTWDQVIEELQNCLTTAEPTATYAGHAPAGDPASKQMMDSASKSFQQYTRHAAELLKSAMSEQQKVQDALKAYQQTDTNSAQTAKHVQGNM